MASLTDTINRLVARVTPTPRPSTKMTIEETDGDDSTTIAASEPITAVSDESIYETESDSDDEFTFYPHEHFYDFPQQSANDQESELERNYIQVNPSVTVHGVLHDRNKAWQFNDMLAYIDFDQDVNVITKNFLLANSIPIRFIRLDEQRRVKVLIQLAINHEVLSIECFVIDDLVNRRPVPLTGSRWRNVRHLRLAHKFREIGDRTYDAIFGYKFYKSICLNKYIFNDASLLIQDTKLGYIISGRAKKTDLPVSFFGVTDDNDSDAEEYNPNKPRNADFISPETGTRFYPNDVLNYQGPRTATFRRRRPTLHDHLFD